MLPRATVPVPGDPFVGERRNSLLAAFGAARYGAPNMLATSIFSPGPMVEDNDTRLI